jgi:hypothetical protein
MMMKHSRRQLEYIILSGGENDPVNVREQHRAAGFISRDSDHDI